MAKRFRRKGGGDRFVQLHISLLKSAAWRQLSPTARSAYVALKSKYFGDNNGSISFSSREAGDALNKSMHTGARALTELTDCGFIEVTEESDFNRKVKIARCYLLTEAPDNRPGYPAKPKHTYRHLVDQKTKVSLKITPDSGVGETAVRKTRVG